MPGAWRDTCGTMLHCEMALRATVPGDPCEDRGKNTSILNSGYPATPSLRALVGYWKPRQYAAGLHLLTICVRNIPQSWHVSSHFMAAPDVWYIISDGWNIEKV